MIKYVIFDMDGTLLDTEKIYRDSWVDTCNKWSLDRAVESHDETIGRPQICIPDILKKYYGGDFRVEDFVNERMDRFFEITENRVPVKPGALELIEYLRANGIAAAVATSTVKDIAVKSLSKSGLLEYFDTIVTGDMVEKGKPAPDIFLKSASMIGAEPSETIVCEDSYAGIYAAKNANMIPVFVEDILPPNDEIMDVSYAVCKDLFEVIGIIKAENASS